MADRRYLKPGRLEDVVLLIQLLALTERGDIYDVTIEKELGVVPASPGVKGWADVARQHPEFFRVAGDTEKKSITLLARYAGRKVGAGQPPHELMTVLIEVALRLAERQANAEERSRAYLPLVTALLAGVFTLVATMLPRWFGG